MLFRSTLFFAFFMSTFATSYAKTLNILINQLDGVQENESENVQVFMDSFMDYMFDSGMIVSSERVSLATDLSNDEKNALKSSKEGYFDYLAIIKVKVDSQSDEVLNASWQLKDVNSDLKMVSGYLVPENKKNGFEKNAIDFGKDVAKDIFQSLYKDKKFAKAAF